MVESHVVGSVVTSNECACLFMSMLAAHIDIHIYISTPIYQYFIPSYKDEIQTSKQTKLHILIREMMEEEDSW